MQTISVDSDRWIIGAAIEDLTKASLHNGVPATIGAEPSDGFVLSVSTVKQVVAIAALHLIIACTSIDDVFAITAGHEVVSKTAVHDVISVATADAVSAGAAIHPVETQVAE